MYDVHAERSAGWSGLAFIVLLIVGFGLAGLPPAWDAAPVLALAYIRGHASGLMVACWLGFLEAAFFLWFLVGLRAYLGRTQDRDEGLPLYAVLTGLFATAIALAADFSSALLVLAPIPMRNLPLAIGASNVIAGVFVPMGLSPFLFACAHSIRRHATAPAWLAYLGYLGSLFMLLATLGIFAPNGAFGPEGIVPLIAFILFVVWMIVTSVQLVGYRGALGERSN